MVSDERSVDSVVSCNNRGSVMNTVVSNNWSMLGSVGEWDSVDCMSHWSSNNRGMVGSVGNNRGMVGRLGMRLSFISHISNESILMVSVVGHNLNSAIGQLNSVFS